MTDGLLLMGHGSRDPRASAEFEALVESVRDARPNVRVRHAYLELAEPLLDTALAEQAAHVRHVTCVPVFLFGAGHVKNDLPLALTRARAAHPDVTFVPARAFGVHPRMVELALARLDLQQLTAEQRARTAVLVVGRGASDPDANGDFVKLTRLIGEGQGLGWVQPAFIGITSPSVPEALRVLGHQRPQRILVLPYFLFTGRLLTTLAAQVSQFERDMPWVKCTVRPHLGPGAPMQRLVLERFDEARTTARPLPCDTCQYRTPMGNRAREVGGLTALLWSLRHTFTHGQAMPHEHAHKTLRKHVLVCGNADCAAAGSIPLINRLRRLVKAAGRARDIRVTRTSCMGRCGEGPTLAIYPDGIWYRGVREHDADDVVHEHLLHDRLVARLVDSIMD